MNAGELYAMGEKQIEIITLDNGLTLEVLDRSRRVAGDRWRVVFAARIRVPLRPELLQEMEGSAISFEDIRNILGDHAAYVQNSERNFIDEKKKDAVFNKLKETFLENNLAYLSAPNFPHKLIMRAYHQSLNRISERIPRSLLRG
jgi:hypothetical protein